MDMFSILALPAQLLYQVTQLEFKKKKYMNFSIDVKMLFKILMPTIFTITHCISFNMLHYLL